MRTVFLALLCVLFLITGVIGLVKPDAVRNWGPAVAWLRRADGSDRLYDANWLIRVVATLQLVIAGILLAAITGRLG